MLGSTQNHPHQQTPSAPDPPPLVVVVAVIVVLVECGCPHCRSVRFGSVVAFHHIVAISVSFNLGGCGSTLMDPGGTPDVGKHTIVFLG